MRSAGVVLLSVCRKVTDHPVSRFATATPPKEGNYWCQRVDDGLPGYALDAGSCLTS